MGSILNQEKTFPEVFKHQERIDSKSAVQKGEEQVVT